MQSRGNGVLYLSTMLPRTLEYAFASGSHSARWKVWGPEIKWDIRDHSDGQRAAIRLEHSVGRTATYISKRIKGGNTVVGDGAN